MTEFYAVPHELIMFNTKEDIETELFTEPPWKKPNGIDPTYWPKMQAIKPMVSDGTGIIAVLSKHTKSGKEYWHVLIGEKAGWIEIPEGAKEILQPIKSVLVSSS